MTEQSLLFDFARSPSFFEQFNVAFNVNNSNTGVKLYIQTGVDSEGEPIYSNTGGDFELVVAEYSPDNIEECLNNGVLASCVTNTHTATIQLDWVKDEFNDAVIKIHDTASISIGESNIYIKAIFLRAKSSGYVLGYCINPVVFSVTNEIVFDDDVIFFSFSRLDKYE